MIQGNGVAVSKSPMWVIWNLKQINANGVVVHEETKENIVVDNGRADVLNLLFGLGASAVLIAMGAGACATAAVHTDSRLNYEYTMTANTPSTNRYTLTDTNGNLLTSADVVSINQTDGLGNNYYREIIVQATIPLGDPNVGQPFQEYGLFTAVACPGTPTGTSGTMFNHLVANSAIIKDNSTQIVVQITLRV